MSEQGTPFTERHILLTNPPVDLDEMAASAVAAGLALARLGLAPDTAEAQIRALVDAATWAYDEGGGVIHTKDPERCGWCRLSAALAPFAGLGGEL